MKRLTYIVVILAVIYSGYWAAGSYALKNALQSQQQNLTAQGWDIAYDTLNTRGFPSRFDTTATNLSVMTPGESIGFAAEMIQILALSYQPNKAIIAFPPEQIVALNGHPIRVHSNGLRASVSAHANTDLSLDQISAEAASVALSLDQGPVTSFSDFLTVIRESSATPNTYNTYFTATDIAWPTLIVGQLPQNAGLPDRITNVTLDATVTLDRTIDRHTIPVWPNDPAEVRAVTLRNLALTWGPFTIAATGTVTIDDTGTPEGTITLTIADWKGVLAAVQSTGLLPLQFQFFAQAIGQSLSQGTDTLALPITAKDGNLFVGPSLIGPVPKF